MSTAGIAFLAFLGLAVLRAVDQNGRGIRPDPNATTYGTTLGLGLLVAGSFLVIGTLA